MGSLAVAGPLLEIGILHTWIRLGKTHLSLPLVPAFQSFVVAGAFTRHIGQLTGKHESESGTYWQDIGLADGSEEQSNPSVSKHELFHNKVLIHCLNSKSSGARIVDS